MFIQLVNLYFLPNLLAILMSLHTPLWSTEHRVWTEYLLFWAFHLHSTLTVWAIAEEVSTGGAWILNGIASQNHLNSLG